MPDGAGAFLRSLGHCDWVLIGLALLLVLLFTTGVRAIRLEARHRRAALRLKTTAEQRALWRSQTRSADLQNLLDDLDALRRECLIE
jgi:hypothetical protein